MKKLTLMIVMSLALGSFAVACDQAEPAEEEVSFDEAPPVEAADEALQAEAEEAEAILEAEMEALEGEAAEAELAVEETAEEGADAVEEAADELEEAADEVAE